MSARAIMLQGTGSDVGKSLLVAALCRIARRRGLSVAPFKPQNMSNNAAACASGGEIGRAQALQALAADIEPEVDMNPVLLKPQSDTAAQIVLQGQALNAMQAADYMANRGRFLQAVLESFQRLSQRHDLIIVEGAGSPAEINLRKNDIANMGFACAARVPVCLVGDIEKGGVIASLVGTQRVLSAEDAGMIRAFIVNKFRGDIRLFDRGIEEIEARTDWPCLGVIPWLSAAARLPAEDAVVMASAGGSGPTVLRICAPMLSRMANFDDADPLKLSPGIDFQWIAPGRAIPRDTDLIILFGSKSTRADMAFLKAQGWHYDIHAHQRSGGHILGLCGGYQMLGHRIADPHGVDGLPGTTEGLGLLDVETIMTRDKRVMPVTATCAQSGATVCGYEIHVGQTHGPDTERPMLTLPSGPDGAISADGRVQGSYIHGLFASDAYRRDWLKRISPEISDTLHYTATVQKALDGLADGVDEAVDVDALLRLGL